MIKGRKILDIVKRRGITKEDTRLILSACIISVYLWSYINFFNFVPSLLKKFSFSEVIGTASYILAFSLIESFLYFLILYGLLCLAAIILPKRLLGVHMAAIGSMLAFLIASIAMYIQTKYEVVVSLSLKRSLFYLGLIGLVFLIYYFLILRFPKFESTMQSIFKHISSLSILYAFTGIISIVIIIFRNILN